MPNLKTKGSQIQLNKQTHDRINGTIPHSILSWEAAQKPFLQATQNPMFPKWKNESTYSRKQETKP